MGPMGVSHLVPTYPSLFSMWVPRQNSVPPSSLVMSSSGMKTFTAWHGFMIVLCKCRPSCADAERRMKRVKRIEWNNVMLV